jgi:hypothetical protein
MYATFKYENKCLDFSPTEIGTNLTFDPNISALNFLRLRFDPKNAKTLVSVWNYEVDMDIWNRFFKILVCSGF